jgi:hypothetical protein
LDIIGRDETFSEHGFRVSGVSPAAGQKNGRSNRKRNSKKANIEGRRKEFFLFYLLKEQSEAASTIPQSSFVLQ